MFKPAVAEVAGSNYPTTPSIFIYEGTMHYFELKVKSITDIIPFVDSREYDQLDALSSSSNMEISQLSVIIKNLKERVESLERNQTDLMDKINVLEREKTG
jgi:predicted  nucleic acid-binding Zn-ribbon protein